MSETDALDGCEVDMSDAETTPEELAALLGPSGGEPAPDQTEAEHDVV